VQGVKLANLGSPLKIDTSLKRSAEGTRPVFAGGAGQISTNVPRQELKMLDSTLLEGAMKADVEANMAFGEMFTVAAEVYDNNEKTKKYNSMLDIEGEYKTFEIAKRKEFSTAYTAKEKEVVRQSYDVGVAKLDATVKGMGWDSLKDRTWAQNLSIGGRKTLAEFQSKTSLALHQETITNFKVQLGEIGKDFANKPNIDPIRHMDDGIALYEKMYDIGGMTKPEFLASVRAFKTKATLARANLLAGEFAKEVDVHDLPSMDEIIVGLQERLDLPITSDLLVEVHETFKTSFFNEMKMRNQANAYAETFKDKMFSVFRQEVNSTVDSHLDNDSMSNDVWDKQIELARTKGDTKLKRILENKKIAWNKSIEVDPRVFRYWTEGRGIEALYDKNLGLNDHGVWDLDKVVEHIRRSDGEYSHTGENTIQGIRSAFKAMNDKTKGVRTHLSTLEEITDQWTVGKHAKYMGNRVGLPDKFGHVLGIDPATQKSMNLTFGTNMGSPSWAKALRKSSLPLQNIIKAIKQEIDQKIQRERDNPNSIFSRKGFDKSYDDEGGVEGWGTEYQRYVIGELNARFGELEKTPEPKEIISNNIKDTSTKLKNAQSLKKTPQNTSASSASTTSITSSPATSTGGATNIPIASSQTQNIIKQGKQLSKTTGANQSSALNALANAGGDTSEAEAELKKQMQNSTQSNDLKQGIYTPATGGFTSRTDKPTGDGTNIFGIKSENQLTKALDGLKIDITPEKEVLTNMWNTVFGASTPVPEPKALSAEDWKNVGKANQAQALKGVVDLGVKIKEGVTGLGKDVAETVGAVATGVAGDVKQVGEHIKDELQVNLPDGSVNHFIDARLQDIGVGRVGEFGEIVAEEIESDIKTSGESIMESLGFLDYEFDGENLSDDIGTNLENKMTFLSDVSLQLNEEMAGVSQALQDDMTFSLGEIKTGFGKVKDSLTPKLDIGKDFDPSDIGYDPSKQSGESAPMFDPAMAQQLIRPIVEEVTKSITESITPKIQAPPSMTREQSTSNANKYRENIGQPPVVGSDGLTNEEREEVRLYPLKQVLERQKDAREHRDALTTTDFRQENPIDFDNTKKINRWIELYNKNMDNKLTAKEKKEFKRLVKYLDTRGLLPEG